MKHPASLCVGKRDVQYTRKSSQNGHRPRNREFPPFFHSKRNRTSLFLQPVAPTVADGERQLPTGCEKGAGYCHGQSAARAWHCLRGEQSGNQPRLVRRVRVRLYRLAAVDTPDGRSTDERVWRAVTPSDAMSGDEAEPLNANEQQLDSLVRKRNVTNRKLAPVAGGGTPAAAEGLADVTHHAELELIHGEANGEGAATGGGAAAAAADSPAPPPQTRRGRTGATSPSTS